MTPPPTILRISLRVPTHAYSPYPLQLSSQELEGGLKIYFSNIRKKVWNINIFKGGKARLYQAILCYEEHVFLAGGRVGVSD